jgi:LuxR family transcriptional regulator, maltose regulon positive regulatory protein
VAGAASDGGLIQPSFAPPRLRSSIVPRSRLITRMDADGATAVVVVAAPAGYGKTTLLSEWSLQDARAVAWLSLSDRDNHPALLLEHLSAALHWLEPLDARTLAGLTRSPIDAIGVLLPRLCALLASRSQPFVLVLDDGEVLTSAGSVEVLRAVTESIPPGSRLVLASRNAWPVPLARFELAGRLVRLDAEHLAMTESEGATALRELGIALDADIERALVMRCEGWPAGLALAALAISHQPDPKAAAERFAGNDRVVGDYFREEILEWLPSEQREFLVRSSVLSRLSGPPCDAILEQQDSAQVLEDLAHSNTFVVPLDRNGETYRCHNLFRDTLRSELHHLEPRRELELHARASEWCETNNDLDGAIEHARAAGDMARASTLVWTNAPLHLVMGSPVIVTRWLEAFTPEQIAASPALAVTKAWWCLVAGVVPEVEQWTSAIAHRSDEVLPDGTPVRAAVALLDALVAKHGLSRMRDEAALAFSLYHVDSIYRPVACQLEGAALHLLGDRDAARDRLTEGASLAGVVRSATYAQCLSRLALLAIEEDDWTEAASLVARAVSVVEEHDFRERPPIAGVHAVAALWHVHEGATVRARDALKHGMWLLEMITGIGPWFVVETRLLLARTSLFLGDVATARMLVRDAERVLRRYPDSGVLPERLQQVRRMTDTTAVPVGVTARPLTPAEMRALRYLPTHLSFEAIAEELFVSRNTVKTQAIAVYRKLGVSSRALAVQRARELGLLE